LALVLPVPLPVGGWPPEPAAWRQVDLPRALPLELLPVLLPVLLPLVRLMLRGHC